MNNQLLLDARKFLSSYAIHPFRNYPYSAISLLLLSLVIIIYEVCFVLFIKYGTLDHGIPITPTTDDTLPGEIYYRYSLISLLIFFTSVCFLSVSFSIYSMACRLTKRVFLYFIAMCCVSSTIGILVLNAKLLGYDASTSESIWSMYSNEVCSRDEKTEHIPIYFLVGRDVICSSIGSTSYHNAEMFFWFRIQWDIIDTFAMVATMFLIFAGITTQLSPIHFRVQLNQNKDDGAAILAFYASQMRELDKILYFASAVLVAGIVHLKVLLSWPLPFVVETSRSKYSDIVLSFVSIEGIFFAMIIAAGFLPLVYGLRLKVDRVVDVSTDQTARNAREKWLEERGWKFGSSQRLIQIASIVAPFFAGPAAQLLGGIT